MLQTLYDYALDYWGKNGVGIMVNALAGSSHSVNSYHVRNANAIKSCQEILQHVLQFDPVLWRDNGRAVQRPRLSLRGAHRILQVCSTRYLGRYCEQNFGICRDRGAIELCYPGSACGGHETWVHCAMAA